MLKSKATAGTYLDTHPKKNGLFPVKLRIVYQRSKKYYPLGIDLCKEDFEHVNTKKPKGELKNIRQMLDAYVGKALEIINSISDFSFEQFEEVWFGKSKIVLDKSNVFTFIEDCIKALRQEERENTAISYNNALSALKAFRNTLIFDEVNVKFLKEFENFMLQRDNSLTTIGIYMRSFRAIINMAIREKSFKQENYPFGKNNGGYVIPQGTGTKDFLTEEQFKDLRNFDLEDKKEDKARDFFVFSCLANGLNFKDICLLKYSNIKDNSITLLREKTKKTTRSKPAIIRISMTAPMWSIIKKWGTVNQYPDDYIFGVLQGNMNETEISKRVKQYIKTTNKFLKKIQNKLKFKVKLTTMVARHTFATILLRKGASKEYLQESFAHASILTTEHYVKGFDDDTRKKWADALIE